MFVIGRNVEVKVEEGKLTIICKVGDVEAGMWKYPKRKILATTHGRVDIPRTGLALTLDLVGPIIR